ncbi:MAG: DUF924 domain-containing protein [Myxococcales bacterium]|nr:MAG: DUF924 domain-containing protein [Myxococcales bacterium]
MTRDCFKNETNRRNLDFWFGPIEFDQIPIQEKKERWYKKDPQFDQTLKERWFDALQAAKRDALDDWATSPRGSLALIILIDQFGRNIFRNTAASFEGDKKALAIAKQALDRHFDRELPWAMRVFLYMPFMHSEDLVDQEHCVELFKSLKHNAPEHFKKAFDQNIDYAIKHKDIIKRFDRFPHRNAILGRKSTPEESAFLEQPGSSF